MEVSGSRTRPDLSRFPTASSSCQNLPDPAPGVERGVESGVSCLKFPLAVPPSLLNTSLFETSLFVSSLF
jgi:hypothetical protein